MTKSEFKSAVYDLLDRNIMDLPAEEKINMLKTFLIAYQIDHEEQFDTSNKRKPWTDEELEIILSQAPTKENCAHFARLFKRGYGSIEQIYRWAARSSKEIKEKERENHTFVQQIKRIVKKTGFRA